MTQIKLLALDMDGTTLMDDHATISPANEAAIKAAIAKGIHVVTATGRMRHRLPLPLDDIQGLRYAVTSNGAAVVDLQTEETLYSNPIPIATALHLVDILGEFPVFFEVYCGGNSYAARSLLPLAETFPLSPDRLRMIQRNRFPVDDLREFLQRDTTVIEKFNLPYLPSALQDAVWARLRQAPQVALTSSVPQNCEINHHSANKADGLSHLCARLGITPDTVMAVGDNFNDLEMLQFAGLSVAPANATDEIKALVDYITASNEEDGVAQAITRFLL